MSTRRLLAAMALAAVLAVAMVALTMPAPRPIDPHSCPVHDPGATPIPAAVANGCT